MTALLFSALVPWLFLIWIFQKIAAKNTYAARFKHTIFLIVMLLAAAVLMTPVKGLRIACWIGSFSNSFSIPLMGLLGIAIVKQTFSYKIFSPSDWKTAWFFGGIASCVLYPSALGLSHVDTYVWGWNCGPALIGVALITAILLFRGNRFGILLLLALAAFIVPLQESTNLWDYVVDPFYGTISLLWILSNLVKKAYSTTCYRCDLGK